MSDNILSGEINGFGLGEVSGVDSADLLTADLGILATKHESQTLPLLTLRQIISKPKAYSNIQNNPVVLAPKSQYRNDSKTEQAPSDMANASNETVISEAAPNSNDLAPLRIAPAEKGNQSTNSGHTHLNKSLHMAGFALLLAGVGYGTYKITEKLTA